MLDRICRIDENLLHRAAGPYIRVTLDRAGRASLPFGVRFDRKANRLLPHAKGRHFSPIKVHEGRNVVLSARQNIRDGLGVPSPPARRSDASRVERLRDLPECPCARLLRLDDRQYVRRVPVSFGLHGGHGTRTRWLSHCASLDYPNEPGAASFPCDEHAADHISDTDVVRRLALFPSRANSRMVTPEAPLCGARRRTWLDPPLDEMVLDLPD